jgi:hypothetical protein
VRGNEHAWVTLDGKHAIDPTLHAPEFSYFGIEFPAKLVAQKFISNGNHFGPLLDDPEIMAVLEAADAGEAQAALRSLDLIARGQRKT